MLAQLVEDLLHLERRRAGLDQHRRPDRAPRDAELLLGAQKHVVPEPRLEVALHLGQVEVGPRPAVELGPGAVEEVEAEVEQASGHPLAVDQQVLLGEVPATGSDHDRREVVLELVFLAVGVGEGQGARDGVPEVQLALNQV